MTNIKCSHCGLVSARTHEWCKRCGAPYTTKTEPQARRAIPKLIPVLIIGCAMLIIGAFLALRFTSAASGTTTLSPNEVHELLSAHETVNSPITAKLLTELTQEWVNGELTDEALLEDHPETLALRRLGLATTDFTVVQIAPDCYRYDEVNRFSPFEMKGDDRVRVRNPNGRFEQCDDLWRYHTTITLRDPETVDQASMSARISSLNDVGLTRAGNTRNASASSTTITIGSVEIFEVSDVVATPEGTYTVGFKCRFKPNSFGELFDFSSPIYKAMPIVVRELFVDSVYVTYDKRLRYLNASLFVLNKETGKYSEGGVAVGHAELEKDSAQWKIKSVSFDQKDQTEYTYHPVD